MPQLSSLPPASPRPVSAARPVRVAALDLGQWRERRRFIWVLGELYGVNQCFVFPLWRDRMFLLDPASNPELAGLDCQAFVAWRTGRAVGRVLAFVDQGYDAVFGPGLGWFGFFDCVEDQDVADALLDAVRQWLRSKGCDQVRGPVQFNLDRAPGVLVNGFLRQPSVGTGYHPPGIGDLLEGCGLSGREDLLSWRWTLDERSLSGLISLSPRGRAAPVVRGIEVPAIERELPSWKLLHDSARADRGVPALSDAAFECLVYDVVRLAPEELVLIAEVDGRAVGCAIAVPDVHPLMPRSGRLLPLAWLRLLRRRGQVARGALVSLKVLPEWRMRGLEASLLAELGSRARAMGWREIDVGCLPEDDLSAHQAMRAAHARMDRRHRIYEGSV